MESNTNRQELLKIAILYAAGTNANTPSAVRRILKQKFNREVTEIEVEAECRRLSGDAVLQLARLVNA